MQETKLDTIKKLHEEYMTKKINIKNENIKKEEVQYNNELLKKYISKALQIYIEKE